MFFLFLLFKILKFIQKILKKKLKVKNFIILISIIFLCILSFNYKSGAGGGFFYKFSIILFKNYTLLFLVFIFSILYFYFNNLLNFNNILIFIILILYNLQYSIYYKYFDPLFFLFFYSS